MNVSTRGYIILFLIVSVFAILLLLPKDNDWHSTYIWNSKEPYGLFHFKNILQEQFDPNQEIEFLKDTSFYELESNENAAYVYINNEIELTNDRIFQVLDYVADGNTALIGCSYFNDNFEEILNTYVFETDTFSFKFQQEVQPVQLINSDGENTFLLQRGDSIETNLVFSSFTDYPVSISQNIWSGKYGKEESPILMKVNIGEGNLYLLTAPIALTNYTLQNKIAYQELHFLKEDFQGKNIFIDKSSYYSSSSNNGYSSDESPLKYIFKDKSLTMAWYVLLVGCLIYLFFKSKRKQRIIPVLEEKQNKALSYVKIIGKLHHQSGNYQQLCISRFQSFLYEIRTRTGIRHEDSNFAFSLAKFLDVEQKQIDSILKEYDFIQKNKDISSEKAMDFSKRLYKLQTRIYNLVES